MGGSKQNKYIDVGGGTLVPTMVVLDASGNSVNPGVTSGALTDRSGALAAGGTAQNAAAALTTRKYLYIENPQYKSDGTTPNAAERLCFRTDAAAGLGSGSICLDIGQSFENPAHFCPTGAVSVIAATTGHAWTMKEA